MFKGKTLAEKHPHSPPRAAPALPRGGSRGGSMLAFKGGNGVAPRRHIDREPRNVGPDVHKQLVVRRAVTVLSWHWLLHRPKDLVDLILCAHDARRGVGGEGAREWEREDIVDLLSCAHSRPRGGSWFGRERNQLGSSGAGCKWLNRSRGRVGQKGKLAPSISHLPARSHTQEPCLLPHPTLPSPTPRSHTCSHTRPPLSQSDTMSLLS